jgi:hypothetical protein
MFKACIQAINFFNNDVESDIFSRSKYLIVFVFGENNIDSSRVNTEEDKATNDLRDA